MNQEFFHLANGLLARPKVDCKKASRTAFRFFKCKLRASSGGNRLGAVFAFGLKDKRRAQLTSSSFFDVMFKTDAWWKVLKMELVLLAITSLLVFAQTRELAALKSQILKNGRIAE